MPQDHHPTIDKTRRPLELTGYFLTNDVLSPKHEPILEVYLSQLREVADSLEEKSEKRDVQEEYRVARIIKSPVRAIPPEVLAIIFRFIIGFEPFNRFIDVARLRGVCLRWRRVALSTQGLWSTLSIAIERWCPAPSDILSFNKEKFDLDIDEQLAPWLAILDKTPSYHLTLVSDGGKDYERLDREAYRHKQFARLVQGQFIRRLFSQTTQPSTVIVNLPQPFLKALASADLPCYPFVYQLCVVDETRPLDADGLDHLFPNLTSVAAAGPFYTRVGGSLTHSALQTLFIQDWLESDATMRQMLQSLPSLRELRLDSSQFLKLGFPEPARNNPIVVHQSLRILILEVEDQLFLFGQVSLPNLQILRVKGCGISSVTLSSIRIMGSSIPQLLRRDPTNPLLISISGYICRPLLSRLVLLAPEHSYLHLNISPIVEGVNAVGNGGNSIIIESDNIEEIFCGGRSASLWWLRDGPARRSRISPMKLHIPEHEGALAAVLARKEMLDRDGFEIHWRAANRMDVAEKLRALVPRLSPYASHWWDSVD